MKIAEFYLLLDELLESPPGTVRGNEKLKDLPKWDSLAIIGFIALLDGKFDLIFPAEKIIGCNTVSDLAALVADKLRG